MLLPLLLAMGVLGASGILISPGSSLTPLTNRFWNSTSGEFGLGFFKPQGAPANTNYVGIVYLNEVNSSAPVTAVWIANRNQPASDNSRLQLTTESGLVLVDSGGTIWQSSSSEGTLSSSGGELLNEGNFVIYSSSNASNVLWQSFDNPTHTLLPGQKLSTSLTSWRSQADPSPGSYTLTISQAMSKLRLLHLSPGTSEYEYWSQAQSTELVFSDELNSTLGAITTGWIMNRTSSLPAQCSGFVNTRYLNFSKRLVLDTDGNLRYYARAPGSAQWLVLWRALYDSCFVYNYCGAGLCNFDVNPRPECPLPEEPSYCRCPVGYNIVEQGCQTSADPGIRCSLRGAIFSRMENAGYDLSNPIGTEVVPGESSCQERCSRSVNCSCMAAVFSKSSSQCWLLSSLVNGNFSSNQENLLAFVRVPGEYSSSGNGLSTGAKIGVSSAGGLIGLLLLVLAGWLLMRKLKQRRTIRDGILDVVGDYGLKSYNHEYLSLITAGFKRVIGQGGFGVVYLGIEPNDEKLAVKVFKIPVSPVEDPDAENKTFLAEVESLASMSHANVVRLLGFCLRGTGAERALVYEYVENSSLDTHLFQKTTELTRLRTRINILAGAAKGIEYFHKYSGRNVVHRDIKPANILLDRNYEAKVADFGMAKMVQAARASVSTTFSLAGTLTYKAPESAMIGAAVTVKADVFSFGVTCIETLTGKKMVFTSGQRRGMAGSRTMLFRGVLGLIEKRCYEDLVDERVELESDGEVEEAVRVLRLAVCCLQEDPRKRPDMETVAMALKGEKHMEQPPLESLPSYLLDDHHEEEATVDPTESATLQTGLEAQDELATLQTGLEAQDELPVSASDGSMKITWNRVDAR